MGRGTLPSTLEKLTGELWGGASRQWWDLQIQSWGQEPGGKHTSVCHMIVGDTRHCVAGWHPSRRDCGVRRKSTRSSLEQCPRRLGAEEAEEAEPVQQEEDRGPGGRRKIKATWQSLKAMWFRCPFQGACPDHCADRHNPHTAISPLVSPDSAEAFRGLLPPTRLYAMFSFLYRSVIARM